MAAEVRAADLPEGTIIGYATLAVIKLEPSSVLKRPWASTHNNLYEDYEVDAWLAEDATVLRIGYGEEGKS